MTRSTFLHLKIKTLSKKYLGDIIKIRRHIHSLPELSFQEIKTSKYIAEMLNETCNLHVTNIAKTGVICLLKSGHKNGKTIALRAESDALPIIEKNVVSYRSKNKGIMHACGHDVHSAALIGAARILVDLKKELTGDVLFIFQPGEEKLPGGASKLIEAGILDKYKPDVIIAQHVLPSMPAGNVGFRKGKYMASADELYFTVKGRGGHAALPGQTVNPVFIASQIVVALQQVAATAPDNIPTVLSIGKVIANGATNVIPDEAIMEGTLRTMDEKWRDTLHKRIHEKANKIANSLGGACEVKILRGYPFLCNDEKVTNRLKRFSEIFLGKKHVEELPIRMTADDFAFYTQKIPGCYYRLGVGNEAKGINSGVHTATFNIDESALETAMGLMAWIAVNELKN